jgi:hypothetical protein
MGVVMGRGLQMKAGLYLLALCALGCAVQSEGKAHLLIQKAMLTNRPFAGKDLPIRYRIFNVGDA